MSGPGYFDNERREYVITNMRPVRPLINYLWNETAVGVCDQFCFGKSFCVTDTRRRALDEGERLLYIKDRETGEFYSANRNYGGLSFDEYYCRVGLGYQTVVSAYGGIAAELTALVPEKGMAILFRAAIRNTGNRPRNLSVYFYLRPTANVTEHTSYGSGYFDKDFGGLLFPHRAFKAPHAQNLLYFKCDSAFDAFEVSDDGFLGVYGSHACPDGLKKERLGSRGTTFEDNYAAAVQFDISLKPGERREYCFVLGSAESAEQAAKNAAGFVGEGTFSEQLAAQRGLNESYLNACRVDTQDAYFDTMANIWLKRQLSLGKTWGRIYGKGFRDVMQDIAAFVSLDPGLARDRILYALKHQYANGNPIRMYEPDYKHPYNDGAAWIPATVCAYVKETGDLSVLDEVVTYLDSAESGSVWEHMLRGMDYLLENLGGRGLTLWGGGDWNDSLNNAGMLGKGESVWLSIATVKAAGELCGLADFSGRADGRTEEIDRKAAALKEAVLRFGRTDGYFVYGYNDYGEVVGGAVSPEGKIYLNPQTWAVLAGIVTDAEGAALMDTVEECLKCGFGYRQLAPSYTKGTDRLGRASYFVPGLVENGSVYNHGVAFKIAADCRLKRGDNAYETFLMMRYDNPDNPDSGVEPYAVTNMYIGPENPYKSGKAPMSWVTGTAGWMYRCLTENICGINAGYEGLIIDPALPRGWKKVKAFRRFRGADYEITIKVGRENCLTVDGIRMTGNTVPLKKSGERCRVEYVFRAPENYSQSIPQVN